MYLFDKDETIFQIILNIIYMSSFDPTFQKQLTLQASHPNAMTLVECYINHHSF